MNDKEEQFIRLVEEHKRTIYKVCYMFSKEPYEIEELFQEILIRLWLGLDSFDGRSEIRTWVYRVALNVAINRQKVLSRRVKTVPLILQVEPMAPDDERKQQIDELYRLISQLDVMDKAIVMLWLEELSYADIAAIVGISPTNVGTRLLRIKNKLVEKGKAN
ncbi:MAG: sigma-70 family RNA polymerase sigma factor [Bacteroidales bacterium]|nr:sigma-70 family RNA polymerase sigma factor [Bacteroidales bacterium]